MHHIRVPHTGFCAGGTQWVVVSAAAAKSRMGNASLVHTRRLPHVPTAVGGTADGTDRSTGDTQNMGESAGTGGTLAWVIARDAPSSSTGHGVAHSGRKVTL